MRKIIEQDSCKANNNIILRENYTTITDTKSIANSLNDYFTSIRNNLSNENKQAKNPLSYVHSNLKSILLFDYDEYEIKSMSLKNNTA